MLLADHNKSILLLFGQVEEFRNAHTFKILSYKQNNIFIVILDSRQVLLFDLWISTLFYDDCCRTTPILHLRLSNDKEKLTSVKLRELYGIHRSCLQVLCIFGLLNQTSLSMICFFSAVMTSSLLISHIISHSIFFKRSLIIYYFTNAKRMTKS